MICILRIVQRTGVWGLFRLTVAVFLLWVVASDTGPRLARLQFAALPDFDYAAEVAYLRTAGRHGEALIVADAGIEASRDDETRRVIQHERTLTEAEQRSWSRRAREVGMGAVSGRGSSLESLAGAVAADFFIIGDVRDIALEGGRYALDGEADELILALSAIGVATTVAPHIDWAPAVLKFARKSRMLTKGLTDHIMHLVRAGRHAELGEVLRNIRRLAAHASPGGAVRLLRHADSAEDVASLANFVERNKRGAFALHVTGKEGARTVTRAARAADGGLDAGQAVIAAASKGQHGVVWLRTGAWRAMARPHALVGLGKGLWKGNVQDFVARATLLMDPRARWILPLLAAWVFMELALLARLAMRRLSPSIDHRHQRKNTGGLEPISGLRGT